jgi:hypothetical protein
MLIFASFTVLALVVAGCGGGGSKSATSSSTTSSTTAGATTGTTTGRGTGAAGFAAYTQCMTSHGIPASALQNRRGNAPPATGGEGGAPPASAPGGAADGSIPTPSLPAGVTQAQYQAAIEACRSQLPAGGFGGGGANSAALAAYRNCLQLHGVTLPAGGQRAGGQPTGTDQTPTSATGSSTSTPGFGGLNSSDPTVQAALKACESLRPTPAQGSSTTSTTAA